MTKFLFRMFFEKCDSISMNYISNSQLGECIKEVSARSNLMPNSSSGADEWLIAHGKGLISDILSIRIASVALSEIVKTRKNYLWRSNRVSGEAIFYLRYAQHMCRTNIAGANSTSGFPFYEVIFNFDSFRRIFRCSEGVGSCSKDLL